MYLVLGFRRRAGSRKPDDTEDLLQEARLALWRRLRTAETLEDAEKYYQHIHRALYNHVRRMAPVYYPEKRFASGIRTVFVVPWELLHSEELESAFEEELIDSIDMEQFVQTLEPLERYVLQMKLEELSQKEIAGIVANGSESRVSRIMKRIREKYRIFQEGQKHAG